MAKRNDVPVANFIISDAAKRGIEEVRKVFDRHSADPAAVPAVGWVVAGAAPPEVAVTFYGRSQYSEMSSAIQVVSGINVVFLPAPGDYDRTAGKVLDYGSERGFFLRDPFDGERW
jgi:hypothetical protein